MTFEAHDLRKEVKGRTLYQDLSFRLEPGQTVAIRGASGSGKSQLLRQLAGLDSDSERGLEQAGRLTYLDRSLEDWDPYQWRAEVCLVPQHAPRLDGTPAECFVRIAGFRTQPSREASDPLELAAAFHLTRAQWEQPWSELSVGERQRSLLAILLSRRPGVLLLDEPTAALDVDSVQIVEAQLRDQTCVWVTHSPEQAKRVADSTLHLSGGTNAD